MQTNTLRGMQTMEQSLADLTLSGVITAEAAFSRTTQPEQLLGLLERGDFAASELARPAGHRLRVLTETQV